MSESITINTPNGSCPCNLNIKGHTDVNRGIPTNLGVGNCDYRQRGLRNNPVFYNEYEPNCWEGDTYKWKVDDINKIEMATYNPDFYPVECGQKNKPCNDTVYFAQDARLFNPLRNQLIRLDRPPYRSTSFLENNRVPTEDYSSIYSPENTKYGQGYKTYSDITAGQITYYTDKDISNAYYRPNFTIPTEVEGVLYRDPMGALKSTYVRKNVKAPGEEYNPLSFIRDTAVHREDIMAGQMTQQNQTKWSARW